MADRFRSFTYLKEDHTTKQYQILVLKETNSSPVTSIEGISLLELTAEQREEIVNAEKSYSTVIGKYMKNYRRFNLNKIKG